MPKWKEKDRKTRKNKVRKGAKYDKVEVLPIVRSLTGLGFTAQDIGIVLGVKKTTIDSWRQRYPKMFEATEEGRQIMKGLLCAQLFRCATGYDYEEKDVTYKEVPTTDEEGNFTGEVVSLPDKTVVHTKHHPASPDLAKFLANNLMSDVFPRNPVQTENNILAIIGSVEPERIKQFAGRLAELCDNPKKIESKDVTNES